MKTVFRLLLSTIALFTIITSCTKDALDHGYENPIDLELSTEWYEDNFDGVQNEIWYRVDIGDVVSQVYIEWSEKDYHGSSRNFTAEVSVDAYWLDGDSEYFVDKDKGYGADARLVNLSTESGLLVRVRNLNEAPGTFALKIYEKEQVSEIELVEIVIGQDWHTADIAEGEILGFLVTGGVESQEVIVQWAEHDSPEEGYTADVKGSVYKLDMESSYKIAGSDKNFSGKDNSHSDNPKGVILDQGENNFVILISLNDFLKEGSFAIQAK
jgi:hypothetical protein